MNSGVGEIKTLRHLTLWNYQPKSRNLRELTKLDQLETLELIQPRIDSLDGIDELTRLESLEVHYSRTLKDISAVNRNPHINRLVFENVPNLRRR